MERARVTYPLLVLLVLLSSCTPGGELLPNSLYFLDGSNEIAQVWRLERDGSTLQQVTSEEAGVDSLAVSPVDGKLAFVSNNQLFLLDEDGGNRKLVADGTRVDPTIEDYVFRGFVSSPVFSPDGKTLAYAFDGLHLYDIATGKDEHVLTNLGNLLGEPFVFTREVYVPLSWSPDGNQLLIGVSYFEGSTLAIMQPGEPQPFQRLWSSGPVCCTYHWSPGEESILAANSSFGTQLPGLWRYDTLTGEEFTLLASLSKPHYVGWPFELPSGELLFFHGEQFSPEDGTPLVLVRSDAEAKDWTQVRPEEFHVGNALWAQDGSLVLITQRSDSGTRQVILVRPDDSPLQVLLEGISILDMAWGP